MPNYMPSQDDFKEFLASKTKNNEGYKIILENKDLNLGFAKYNDSSNTTISYFIVSNQRFRIGFSSENIEEALKYYIEQEDLRTLLNDVINEGLSNSTDCLWVPELSENEKNLINKNIDLVHDFLYNKKELDDFSIKNGNIELLLAPEYCHNVLEESV